MDRRVAVGMLGAATLGALSAGEARADDAETNPVAARLKGRRVTIFAADTSYRATVEFMSGSLLWLRDVEMGGGAPVKEAVVDISACKVVLLKDEPGAKLAPPSFGE